LKIQFYSLTTVDDAVAAVDAGADLIGLVVDDSGRVPEEITPDQARAIFAAIDGRALGIALSLSADLETICLMVEQVQPHAVHLAASDLTIEDMARVRARIGTTRIMAAVPVTDASAVELARERAVYADYLLLDSTSASDPFTGATGETHDWSVSRRIVEAVSVPAVLAGGLSADNVGEAIEAVRPWGVDSMTHTNLSGDRTRKDAALMRAFVAAAQSTADRLGL
jgi:phosphoribosylanthranilate isomerase